MKMHTVTRVNPAQVIAESGAGPIRKQDVPTEGMDARMQASVLVSSVMAHVVTEDGFWKRAAVQLIQGTTDFRAAFVKVMGEQLKECKRRNAEAFGTVDKDGKANPTKGEVKLAGQRVSGAAVQISRLNTIAHGFNGGGNLDDLISWFAKLHQVPAGSVKLDAIGFMPIYEYAQTFKKSEAGRKPDAWLVKFGKWLDSAGKVGEDADDETKAQYAKAVALFNSMSKV